jgi:hypothetical protein
MVLIKEGRQIQKLDEAFRSGQAYRVLGLFIKVLSKRIHKQLMTSPYPYEYITSEGKFSSYYSMFPDGKRALRTNFLLNDSDSIHSIDFFKTPGRIPDLKIYLDGLNIIQILKTVEDAVNGQVEDSSESTIHESKKPQDLDLEQWFGNNISRYPADKLKISQLNADYIVWCRQTGKSTAVNSYGKLRDLIKKLAVNDSRFVPQEVSLGRVETNTPIDRQIIEPADAASFSEVQDEADDHLAKFDMLRHYLKVIASKNQPNIVNGLVVFGKAGMGKTTTVEPTLASLHVKTVTYSGKVGGPTALYQLLWKHSSYDLVDIIIFDDCDNILGNKDAVDILKKAMDDKEVRVVDYVVSKVESVLHEDDEPVTLADFGQTVNSDTEVEASKAPTSFAVSPKVIFISNLKEFPPPITSRCLSVKFEFTEDQVYDLIIDNVDRLLEATRREQLAGSAPGIIFREVTRDGILEVINFCRSLKAGVDRIDFRQIKFAITIWSSCQDETWKRWVRLHFRGK